MTELLGISQILFYTKEYFMIEHTSNLHFYLLSQYQANKEAVINENFNKIDCLLNRGVISRSITSAPSSPEYGALYIVSDSSDGIWASNKKSLALYLGEWLYFRPKLGMVFWIIDEKTLYVFFDNDWHSIL